MTASPTSFFRNYLLIILLVVAMISPLFANSKQSLKLVGDWNGTLSIGEAKLRLLIHFTEDVNGDLSGHLVSVDQDAMPIALTNIVFSGQSLTFDVPNIGGRFAAVWDPERAAWVGDWLQNGKLPLVLYQGKPIKQVRVRPQEPRAPFPYQVQEVALAVAPGIELAGTLTLPIGNEPTPAVVLITGSGPQNRDEELFGHRPFLVLADFLTRRGVAVLRLDDRGTGMSTGEFAKATMLDFAKDIKGAVAWLSRHRRVVPAQIGLIGHSEGALVASLVAAEDPTISFIVLLSGPGVNGEDILISQIETLGKLSELSDDQIASKIRSIKRINSAIFLAQSTKETEMSIREIMTDERLEADIIAAQLPMVTSPWYAHFVRYDPRNALEQLRIPLLAINGQNDAQVVAKLNLPSIRAATSNNKRAKVIEFEGLNHLLQTSKSGNPSDYEKIDETIAPVVLKTVGEWIDAQFVD
jgi:pimeloyl-ACP methyl ester carboxylesterase